MHACWATVATKLSRLRLNFRRGLFLNRRYNHVIAARPRCIDHEQGKAAVAGDESEALGHVEGSLKEQCRGRRGANYFAPSAPPRLGVHHLIIPRSELSTNRISISTSSP